MTVGFSFLDDLEDFFRAGDKPFGGTLDVHRVVFVLVNGQVDLGGIQKITDLVQIDLEIGNFDVELQILLHGVNVVEDVVDNAGNDSLEAWVEQKVIFELPAFYYIRHFLILLGSEMTPSMVCVLPDEVWPYAKMVPL